MPIKEVSKYNYKEVCDELGIDFNDFLSLAQSKGIANSETIKVKHTTALEVIKNFTNSLLHQNIRKVKSKNTVKYYVSFLQRLDTFLNKNNKDLLFKDFNEEVLYQFIDEVNNEREKAKGDPSPLSQSTLNTYIAIIKRICTYSVENGYIDKNMSYKFKKIKINYLPRYFSNEQLKNIFKLVEKRRCPLLWKTIFFTLLGTGLRINEVSNLRLKDIDFTKGLIYTIGKGNKERYIPLYPTVKEAILYYLKATSVEILPNSLDGYVFCRANDWRRQKKISDRSIQYNLMKIRLDLKLDERYTVHSFRHTFAVNCLKAKMNIMYLSQILGHESPSTTAIYTKLLPHDLQGEIFEKYPIPLEGLIKEIIGGDDLIGEYKN
jgi:site-specific recombinase XerD